jgi:Nitronate monooxygenase
VAVTQTRIGWSVNSLAGNCPVGCGFITWALAKRPATLDLALSHHPPAIMLSFGDATPFLPKVKRAGALAICQIQSLAQARAVLLEGADIIVAQGTEAGGHGGGRSTLPLVPAVVDMIARSGRDTRAVHNRFSGTWHGGGEEALARDEAERTRYMPRRQRAVTLISPSFSRARALTSYTRSSPHLSFSRSYSRRPRRRLHGPSP